MKNIITSLLTAAVVCVLFLAGSNAKPNTTPALGGNFEIADKFFSGMLNIKGGFNVSTTTSVGTTISKVLKGTCNLTGGAISATSSANGECTVTGIIPGDQVFATLSATTTTGASIVSAIASSTAGTMTVRILNLTGAASTISALGSTTQYLIIR